MIVIRTQRIRRFGFTAEKNIKYNTIALYKGKQNITQKFTIKMEYNK